MVRIAKPKENKVMPEENITPPVVRETQEDISEKLQQEAAQLSANLADAAVPKIAEPMSSRAIAEQRPPIVAVPTGTEQGVDDIQHVDAVDGSEDEEFIKTASKEELDKIRALTEKDVLSSAIIAVDLRLPNAMDVKPKDPIWVFFWGNRKYDGPGGNRYEQLKAIGFLNAQPSDVKGVLSDMLRVQDGGIIYQDAILLKILKSRWLGYQKANIIKANQLHSLGNIKKEAKKASQEELKRMLAANGLNNSPYASKLRMFDPESEQLTRL